MCPLAERRPPSRRRTLLLVLKIVFSVSILALIIVYKAPVRDILGVFRTVGLGWLVLAFSLHAVGIFASAYRWQILARAQGDEIPLGYLMRSYLVGTFFSNFLPSSFGGDIVRIWDGSRYSRSLVRSSAVVVVERATGIVVLFLFALFASLFRLEMANDVPVIWAALVLGLAGLALAALFFTPFAERFIRALPGGKFLRAPKEKILAFRAIILDYRHHKGPFLWASFWALVLQTNVVIYFFFIGKAFRLDIGFPDYFIFVPIVLLVQALPVTINGLGLREGSTVEIFKYYLIPAGTAVAFSLVDVGFRLVLGAVGGISYASRK
ncbi:MAG TPA: lysylphosphatidylglycerol synthase transmembrane domain-containing protein [Acidobacteriota bacterium]|nr:lysylphosphatidylglycerol synthase transmembrane domain-containing protein [Acidobacteriota bacterium]